MGKPGFGVGFQDLLQMVPMTLTHHLPDYPIAVFNNADVVRQAHPHPPVSRKPVVPPVCMVLNDPALQFTIYSEERTKVPNG